MKYFVSRLVLCCISAPGRQSIYAARVLTLIVLFVVASLSVQAQREQLGVRYEFFGERGLNIPNPSASQPGSLNGKNVSAAMLTLNAGIRSQLDDNTLLINGFQYRYLNVSFPTLDNTQISKDFHLLFYDFFLFRTLSDQFQLVAILRPGIFSDFQNVALNHARLEAVGFVDWFLSDNLTLGLGVAYQSSVFGRLITVPVLHVVHTFGDFLLDMLLPSRGTLWYYPNPQLEIGFDIWLNGSQYRMGAVPAGIRNPTSNAPEDQVVNFFFSNVTVGPVVRYKFFDKFYLSAEGGYTLFRRLGFGDAKLNEVFIQIPPFNAGNNTWFARFGVQVPF